jgi:hypothetical protein
MRRFVLWFLTAMVLNPALGAERTPKIGETIVDLRFNDIRALQRSLADLGKPRAYVFVFTSTQCPLVRRTMPKLVELHNRFAIRDVQFVVVNVGPEDTIRDMAAQAIDFEAPFVFVKDADLSCAHALGAERTPEVIVLNAERKLVYRGRIDDQLRLGGTRPEPTRRDLEEALQEVLDGRAVTVAETPVDGCPITKPMSFDKNEAAPTFYRDVAPILYKRCVSCHHSGTAAPFALLTYSDVLAQAEMMAEVVRDERMPPWFANSRHGTFQNDPSLSRLERETLMTWVASGRVEGDPEDGPAIPSFPDSKWRIGDPDLIITMVEQHSIPATGFIPYRYAVLPHLFLEDTWVEAVEIRPDNATVVHHCNLAYVTANGASERTFITGHVPGGQPLDLAKFDNGVGYLVPRLSVLALQIHYTTTGKPENCRFSVGLRFPRRIIQKQFQHFLLDPHAIKIPPGHGAYQMRASHVFDRDITLLGLFTHMHVRGKDMTFYADVPGQSRETLLQIPNYNFEWQLGYEIEPGKKRLPAGTRIEAVAHYDNSAFNPYNPDPKRTVPWGLQSIDEMFNGFVFFVADQEQLNIHVDSRTGHQQPAEKGSPETNGDGKCGQGPRQGND